MEFTADYFIEKFSPIPEELWFEGDYQNATNPNCKCALGHCGCNLDTWYDERNTTKEAAALIRLFDELGLIVHKVNDGKDERYTQSTPKQRILAALEDIKKDNAHN